MWQLEVPVMTWSGSTVRNEPHKVYSLKEAVSGRFLRARKDVEGALEFGDTDDTPLAHWRLKPLDEATTAFQFERTKFMLQNASTGWVVHISETVDVTKPIEDSDGSEDDGGLDASVHQPAIPALSLPPQTLA